MFIDKNSTTYQAVKAVGCFAAHTAAKSAVVGACVAGTYLGLPFVPFALGRVKLVRNFVVAGGYLGANAIARKAADYVQDSTDEYVDDMADCINQYAEVVTELFKNEKENA